MINKPIKKALVTGSSGFIGRALVKGLVHKGIDVLAIDRNPSQDNLCESHTIDVTNESVLDKFLTNETVLFHMAAGASVPDSVTDPKEDFFNTCYGLFNILESARKSKCRVIFPSTASIFDINNQLPVSEKSYVKPSSPYGAAKVAGEAYSYSYHRCYGLDIRIARMFSVYGIGMNRFAVYDIINKIKKNSSFLEVLGDGTQIRDYLYISDVVDGLQLIAENGEPGEDYNLASGVQTSILDLAKEIAILMNVPDINIETSGKSFPGDIPKWYADINKIKAIGFKQETSLVEGLRRTIEWLK